MMQKTLKIYIILLISCGCFIYPVKTLNGCGGDYRTPEDDFHFLLNQNAISAPEYQPFYLYYGSDLHPYPDSVFNSEERNIDEWYIYFKKKISRENIWKLVYEYDSTLFKSLKSNDVQGKEDIVSSDMRKYYRKRKHDEVINYLIYVRGLKPFVECDDPWGDCFRDSSEVKPLLENGEDLFRKSKSKFIKMRVGYQLTRLAHYAGMYDKCVYYYDEYVGPFSSESVIKYKALGHKAGSLKQLGKIVEATYLYSIVFTNCIEKRVQAFHSMYYVGDSLSEALKLCKNDQEKTTLYFLNALENSNPYPTGLNNLYNVNPSSKELELLVIREIKKIEAKSTPYYEWYSDENEEFTKDDLKAFVISCVNNNKVKNKAIWYFFAGYLDFRNNSYPSALMNFEKIHSYNNSDPRLNNQIRIIETIIKVDQKDIIDLNFENEILAELKWLESIAQEPFEFDMEYIRARNYIMNRLQNKYLLQNDRLKADLCENVYAPIYLYDKTDVDKIDVLWNFLKKTNRSPMEEYLGLQLKYTLGQLNEMKGTLALRSGEFKKAIQFFNESDLSNQEKSFGDPFEFKINNCMECGSEESKTYTRPEFAKKMLEYEKFAKTDKKKAAYYYFMLGSGLFNITYYGTSYNLGDYYRPYSEGGSSEDVVYSMTDANGLPDDAAIKVYYSELRKASSPYNHYDCMMAMEYFQKAMNLATDKELAAKACYMAAKCEESNRYQGIVDIDHGLGKHKYYKILKDKYNNTNFYDKVISECKYFDNYVKDPI